MTGEKVSFDKATSKQPQGEARHNDRSTIVFPYLDLDTAVIVTKALYERAGLGECGVDELAAQMGQTVSGAFRLKIATAMTFTLIEKGDRASYRLSALGRQIVAPDTEPSARAAAFLKIPLYTAIFERYRGRLLPPTKALEREMNQLGVAPKQTSKARQAFERSAKEAGFGSERLVQPRFDRETLPPVQPQTVAVEEIESGNGKGRYGGGGDGTPPGTPLEYLLIDLLKRPGVGDQERQAIWTLVQFLSGKASGGQETT